MISVTDPLASILTGNDLSLLPLQGQAMIGGLALTPGFADVYTATDEDGILVGYIICTPPEHVLFSKYVAGNNSGASVDTQVSQ